MTSTQSGIFTRSEQDIKKDLRISSTVNISHLSVRNGVFVAAINNKTLLKLSVVQNDKSVEINLPVSHSEVLGYVHVSPSGCHCIASYKNGDNFYIHLRSNTSMALKRIRGIISAVGWNPEVQKDDETGPILLGSYKGAIHETNINSAGTVAYLKEMMSGIDKDLPVCDIRLFMVNDDDPKHSRWAVLICLPNRLFSLCGTVDTTPKQSGYTSTSSLQTGWTTLVPAQESTQHIFHQIFNHKDNASYTSVLDAPPSSSNSWAHFAVHPAMGEPSRFVWMSGRGYSVGRISLNADRASDVLELEKTAELPRVEGLVEDSLGVSLTEYHILIVFAQRLVATSIFTQAVVFEDKWNTADGVARGVTFDPSSEYHWIFTPSSTIKYQPNDETRYVWRILLDRGEYPRALSVARARMNIDPSAYELVLKRQAEKHMAEKRYIAAAEILACSSEPFEAIVLRFLSTDDDRRAGLKVLLEKKLDQYTHPEDRMKFDAIVLWLLEVQLSELAENRRGNVEKKERADELRKQIRHYIARKNVFDCIRNNREAVYKLLVSHADFDNQLYLATKLKDWETIISIHLLRQSYKEALSVLQSENVADLFYKYSPLLVSHVPSELFTALSANPKVRPQRLMPTLAQCQNDEKLAVEALTYLEWAVRTPAGAVDVSLNNLLITMYSRHRPNKLLNYLESCGKERFNLPYELDFAIRTTQQQGLERCTVFLYCVSEMFMEAIDVALKMDVNLAKDCAKWMDASDDDFLLSIEHKYPLETRRRVWMNIACHIIRETGDASAAIRILKESGDVIKIQDILPFFPDFTKIQHFKEPLCECLKEHSAKIQNLQTAMKEATQIATEIRERTDKLKKRVTVVRGSEVCSGCSRTLCTRPFYSHSCRHFFHRDCLEEKMEQFLNKNERTRLEELVEMENRLLQQLDAEERVGNKGKEMNEKEQRLSVVSSEISELIGSDCPLCGMFAIDQIDQPLFTPSEYIDDSASWLVGTDVK